MASARLGIKVTELSSMGSAISPRSSLASSQQGVPAAALSSSPGQAEGSTMLSRALTVLKRHQCGYEEETVAVCMRQAAAASSTATKPSAFSLSAANPCGGYINSLRYCQLQTQQHNYPVAPALLY